MTPRSRALYVLISRAKTAVDAWRYLWGERRPGPAQLRSLSRLTFPDLVGDDPCPARWCRARSGKKARPYWTKAGKRHSIRGGNGYAFGWIVRAVSLRLDAAKAAKSWSGLGPTEEAE